MSLDIARAMLVAGLLAVPVGASAQEGDSDLAMQLANPVASLVSVPFQFNWDQGFGPDDGGERLTVNVQPVVPFSLNPDWNVIVRTIVPVISQDGIPPGADSEFGLGDTVQSLFFSPKQPSAGGWIFGVGPVLLWPTATESDLGADTWGAGPTALALRQTGPWTVGALANHIWSVSGDTDISSTFLQPFVSYTTPTATGFFLNTESTYDWEREQWSVPINAGVNQLLSLGGQKVQLGAGVGYWAESPANGPEGWRARLNVVFLFPAG